MKRTRHQRVALAAGGAAVALLCTGLTTVPATAVPAPDGAPGTADDRLTDAAARARALRLQVDALEVKAALAAEDQATASEELGRVISDELAAEGELDDARDAGALQRAQASRRARALYMSGGHAGMVASVLGRSSGELGDVLLGMRTVQTLVGDDAAAVGDGERTLDHAVDASTRVQQLRVDRQRLTTAAADAARQLTTALEQQRALVAEADADVAVLAEQQRQDEEQAALARAAQETSAPGALGRLPTGPGEPPSTAAPTPAGQHAIDAATTMLGRPYQWGAVGPDRFDCSGLTSWAYRQAGISIPRTSRAQYAALPKVPLDRVAAGDLVFFATGASPSSIHHVGIYVGAGRMLHAPRTGDVVKVSAVWRQGLYGAVRPTS